MRQWMAESASVYLPTAEHMGNARVWIASWKKIAGDIEASLADLEAVLTDFTEQEDDGEHTAEMKAEVRLSARMQLVEIHAATMNEPAEEDELERLRVEAVRLGGEEREESMHARQRLGFIRAMRGETSRALTEFLELRKIVHSVLNPDDPRVMSLRRNIALLRERTGDTEGAIADFRGLVADGVRIYGTEDSRTRGLVLELESLRGASCEHPRFRDRYGDSQTQNLQMVASRAASPSLRDALRAPWTHPPRREHPPPRGSGWKKNGRPADYARTRTVRSAAEPQVKAGLTVDCKSVANSGPVKSRAVVGL